MSAIKYICGFILFTCAGAASAASTLYAIEPSHTFPSLEFSHMGISIWRGKFDKTSGEITIDRDAQTGSVHVVIDTRSINFGLAAMDDRARSDDFFNVAQFPTATYTGSLKFVGNTPATVDGQLTFRGVTRPLTLTLDIFGCVQHPMLKKEVCGADAKGQLSWSDYGMKMKTIDDPDATTVTLHIQVEAIKQQ